MCIRDSLSASKSKKVRVVGANEVIKLDGMSAITISEEEQNFLYNGEVEVRYEKFSFLALGSYGITEDKKTSVFIYLMLDYAFGGPPCFYITGLVADVYTRQA